MEGALDLSSDSILNKMRVITRLMLDKHTTGYTVAFAKMRSRFFLQLCRVSCFMHAASVLN